MDGNVLTLVHNQTVSKISDCPFEYEVQVKLLSNLMQRTQKTGTTEMIKEMHYQWAGVS